MNAPLKLGRIWAVPIRGAYSLLVLVAVLAGMTGWQYSSIADGQGVLRYGLAGVFSAALFIWTVYAHEAAHVAAARHFGARVHGVTLSLRGGETAIGGQPASPWQGIVVATSGPAVSIVCGLGCGVVALAASALHAPTLIVLCFAWVGVLSVLLAAANLIPAAPLDGGHVLQALVWWATGNRVRASAVSGFAGQIVGAAILFWAAWLALFEYSWIAAGVSAIVAWPLWRGASATRRAARQRAQLGGLQVQDVMRSGANTLPAGMPAAQAEVVSGATDSYVAVVDQSGRPKSVLSRERIRRAARAHPDRPLARLIRRRGALVTATPDESLADVLERTNATPKPVLVLVDGQPGGMLAPEDIGTVLANAPRQDKRGPVPVAPDAWPGVRRPGVTGINRTAA